MHKLLLSKKGLSTVVTTLIILSAGVLTSASVTYYSTNIASSRVTAESVAINQALLWVTSSGSSGAFVLTNNGGRDVIIDKLTVRGAQVTWGDIYLWRASDAGITITSDMTYQSSAQNTTQSSLSITIQAAARTFSQQSGKIPLKASETVVVYMDTPGRLALTDIGLSASMGVYTSQTSFITESIVKSGT